MEEQVTGYRLSIFLLDEKGPKRKEIGDYETLEKAKSIRDDLLKSGYEYENLDYYYYPPHSIIKIIIVKKHR